MILFSPEEFITIGRVLKTHGHRGELKVDINPAIAETLLAGEAEGDRFVFLEIQKKPVPFLLENIRGAAPALIIKLKEIDDLEAASELRNRRLQLPLKEVPREILEELEEMPLEGFQVYNADGNLLGTVIQIGENPLHPLLFITTPEEQELIVPLQEEFIREVDWEARRINADVPEDLLNL